MDGWKDCSHDEWHEGGQVKRQQLGQQKSEEVCRKHIQTHIIYIYMYLYILKSPTLENKTTIVQKSNDQL